MAAWKTTATWCWRVVPGDLAVPPSPAKRNRKEERRLAAKARERHQDLRKAVRQADTEIKRLTDQMKENRPGRLRTAGPTKPERVATTLTELLQKA